MTPKKNLTELRHHRPWDPHPAPGPVPRFRSASPGGPCGTLGAGPDRVTRYFQRFQNGNWNSIEYNRINIIE